MTITKQNSLSDLREFYDAMRKFKQLLITYSKSDLSDPISLVSYS